jgi:hypothetical protein
MSRERTKFVLLGIVSVLLIGLIVGARLLPHVWNMTPVIAIAIVAGIYMGPIRSGIIVFSGLLLSDLFIGFYDLKIMLAVYGSFAVVILFSKLLSRKAMVSVAGAVFGSTFFFLVTNAAVWFFGSMYSKGLEGLMTSYIAGLPFYRSMLVGDIVYTTVLFSVFSTVYTFRKDIVDMVVGATTFRDLKASVKL